MSPPRVGAALFAAGAADDDGAADGAAAVCAIAAAGQRRATRLTTRMARISVFPARCGACRAYRTSTGRAMIVHCERARNRRRCGATVADHSPPPIQPGQMHPIHIGGVPTHPTADYPDRFFTP